MNADPATTLAPSFQKTLACLMKDVHRAGPKAAEGFDAEWLDGVEASRGMCWVALALCSLRHSIGECVMNDLRHGKFAAALSKDDPKKPCYFLHGSHRKLNISDPALELWTIGASTCTSHLAFYPSVYAFSSRLSNSSTIHLAPIKGEDPASWKDFATA